MRIEYLQFLLEVAKHQSISKAAKKLYISQTGLSTIINSIEQELNIQIFKRTNKGILLTEQGAQALELVKDILHKNEELHYLFSSTQTTNQIINLGVVPSAANALTHHLMQNWAVQHSNAYLHIYQVGYEDTATFLKNHTANILVSAAMGGDAFSSLSAKEEKLHIERVYTDRFCLFVSSESDLADKDSISLEEIMNHHLLLTHTYPGVQDKAMGQLLHKFPYFTVLSNLEIAKSVLIERPDTVMVAPSLASLPEKPSNREKIKMLDITSFDATLDVYILYDISSRMNISETLLLDEIRSFFSSM